MPYCENCGSTVSKRFVQVMFGPDVEHPPGCPSCPDMTRVPGGQYRPVIYV